MYTLIYYNIFKSSNQDYHRIHHIPSTVKMCDKTPFPFQQIVGIFKFHNFMRYH
jgi:hypothetical protein